MNNRILTITFAFIVDCLCWFLFGCFLISLCLPADGATVRDTFINFIDFSVEEERESNMTNIHSSLQFSPWKSPSTYYCQRDDTYRRANNDWVVKCWERGEACVNASGSFETDGDTIFSYGRPIGWTRDSDGKRVLANYRASTPTGKWTAYWWRDHRTGDAPYLIDCDDVRGEFGSVTTSIHVGRAMQVANYIYHPTLAIEMAQC